MKDNLTPTPSLSCLCIAVLMSIPWLASCVPAIPPTSDVPCLLPIEWGEEILTPRVRAVAEGSNVLLVTGQTWGQIDRDDADGSRDYRPHSAVYRLDPAVGAFELVDDTVWDDAVGVVRMVSGSGPSRPLGAVEIAGRQRLSTSTSPTHAVAAVLSSQGYSPGVPFVSSGFGTGQHYHQLFSEVDRSQIGTVVRVGVGDTPVVANWTAQEDYVIHWQRASQRGTGETMLCAVPITEDLPPLEGE